MCHGGSCVSNSMLCSQADPTGICDSGQTCRAGQCIDNSLLCSAQTPTGPCADPNQTCLGGACVANAMLCSMTNPAGLCQAPLACHNGTCSTANPCSAQEPQGTCQAGDTCLNGTCVLNAMLCSMTNTTGMCVTGKTCLDGTCTDNGLLCSAAQPTGLCPMGQACFNAACVASSSLCSAQNMTGACTSGKTCLGGSCVDVNSTCMQANPTGLCVQGQSCVDGNCVDQAQLCSMQNPNGVCSHGLVCTNGSCTMSLGACAACTMTQSCLDGSCRDTSLLCSMQNPTGLCASGFNCIAGSCIDAGDGCSATNQSGVCGPGLICNAGTCRPIDDQTLCDDGNPCTSDSFDFARNRCTHEPVNAACNDGNACTTDVCMAGVCVSTPIMGCVEPPVLNPYVTPTNVSVLNLSGTKPSGASIEINGRQAVPQNPDTTWGVTLNLAPGDNVYVVRSINQGVRSATITADIVYDITPPVTTLTPTSGVFLNGITVRVVSSEPAKIYYTTDGARPDIYSDSFQSVKEFRIFDDTTLRFLAIDRAGNWETSPVTASYQITSQGNKWHAGPSLSRGLIHAGAAVLDNSVIIAGGSDGTAPWAGVESYDFVAGAWSSRPSLAGAREELGLATLNGVVYAVGGQNNGTPLNTVEVYNPTTSTRSWSAQNPMPSTRYGLVAVPLNDKLYVLGGKTNGGNVLTNLEVFDPSGSSWTNNVAQMPRARYAFGAVARNGKIYVVGGEDAHATPIAQVDIYDPSVDSWTSGAPMPTPRSFAAVSLMENIGNVAGGYAGVVVAGGRSAGGSPSAIVEEYIIEDNVWRERSPLPAPRHGGAAIEVPAPGDVDSLEAQDWFIGGQLPTGISETSVYYTENQKYVRHLAPMPVARFAHGAAALNGRIYLFGGRNFQEEEGAWVFDPETETYDALPALASFQNGTRGVAVGDYVYAVGGADNFGNAVANLRAYDPIQRQWIDKAPLQVARKDAAVVAVGDSIYVIGGYNNGALQTVEIYDTTQDRWSSGTVLPEGRTGAVAVARAGMVFVIGGRDAMDNPLPTILQYNQGTWASAGISTPAAYGAGFLIDGQQMNVFAGRDGTTLTRRIWSYDFPQSTLSRPQTPETQLLAAYDLSAPAYLYGKVYLFGGNSNPMIGPSGETLVQKIEGRCFNGVQDGREIAPDTGGGCPQLGYLHHTGFPGETFYNGTPSNTSSLQGAIDACNAHFNAQNCSVSCPNSNCTNVTQGGGCSCSDAPRWDFGNGTCYSTPGQAPGLVEVGGACPSPGFVGNWD
jgi:N-acetylneuraminic acid mutarotase